MARLPRIVIPNQPLHIMHRGNNRQDIFENDDDMARVKEDLSVSLSKSTCKLHAYVVMTNHIHLLVTPKSHEDLRIFMQSFANRYVRYFNKARNRSGTIWEGRFKSCLVDSENYLFTLYNYIEMNPIKAGMVKELDNYAWSSYHHNALGLKDKLITEHSLYKALAKTDAERAENYREMFETIDLAEQGKSITDATWRGEVLGDAKFHKKIANKITRPTKLSNHGGDRKSEGYKNAK